MPRSGALQGLRRGFGVFRIDRVAGTNAGEFGTGGLECGREFGGIGKTLAVHGLDAAGLEQALRKGHARREIGRRAEIGQKHFWSGAARLQSRVGFVAQGLERLGQPDRRQRIELVFWLTVSRQRDRRRHQHHRLALIQVWKLAGAGQHLAALRDVGVTRCPRGRDLALEQALLKRSESAAGCLALLEQRPGLYPFCHLPFGRTSGRLVHPRFTSSQCAEPDRQRQRREPRPRKNRPSGGVRSR